MRKLFRRFYFMLNRQRLERELIEEMESHREMMPPECRPRFGTSVRLIEESRDAWSWVWIEELWQDLSYGARVLKRAPGFTLGAMAVLALGIGVNLAEFQIFDAMAFHRLTIRDADSILQFTRTSRQGTRLGFPPAATRFYRETSNSFAWLITEDPGVDVVIEADAEVRTAFVSSNYFGSLGIVPALGRLLDPNDSLPGAPPVVVLGYEYWKTHWSGDPKAVGRAVRVNNKPVQIVAVLPPSFSGIVYRSAVWFPSAIRPLLVTGSVPAQRDFSHASEALYGKLKPGVSQTAGEAELTLRTQELAVSQPRYFPKDERVQAHLIQESNRRFTASPVLFIFMVMVLLVLFSACANLGNMLLARGLARQHEINIRMAIGASRMRVVRQLMTESFLLAILGGIAGLAFGAISSRVLLNALAAPPDIQLSMSWPLVAAGFSLALLSAVMFGLPSALQTARPNSPKRGLWQSLVGVQVAVSCLLLIASGVLAHKGFSDLSINLAFDYQNMLVIHPEIDRRDVPDRVARQRLDALAASLTALPGVDAMTAAIVPPLSQRPIIDHLPGFPPVFRNAVQNSYFAFMNLPFVRGRSFLPGDRSPLIVSETAARAVWPNLDPVGKTLKLAGVDRTVTGVVKDSGMNLLANPDSVEAYVPIDDAAGEQGWLILHARSDLTSLVRMIPATAAALNETVSVSFVRERRDRYFAGEQRLIKLIASIGTVATALAGAGMFALVAFAVAQRRRELGIRIAIGAGLSHILRILLTQNAKPTASGAVVGAILAAILARLVRSIVVLQKIDAVDIVGFAAGLASFALIALLATLAPAMRALRIDPSTTLREE